MSEGLVLSSAGRPAIIKRGSCSIYVSVHDQFYRRRLQELKQLVRDCHPDRRWWTLRSVPVKKNRAGMFPGIPTTVRHIKQPNATGSFLGAMRLLKNFIEEEKRYYQQFGLRPPTL